MEKRIVAFSYTLLYLAQKYSQYNHGISQEATLKLALEKFNEDNNFILNKCNLFPFLVTIGNGKKLDLLLFFEEFSPVEYGFIQPDLMKEFNTRNISIFEIDDKKQTLKITDAYLNSLSNEADISVAGIKNFLKFTSFQENELSETIVWIKESISNIENKKIDKFMSKDFHFLSEWSRNNHLFNSYIKYYTKDGSIKAEYISEAQKIKRSLLINILTYDFSLSPYITSPAEKVTNLNKLISRLESTTTVSK